uniref:Uncharacterized protein n=1 Tax=Anguilla anguilla TaxID=7936 RepID=A0A0E9QF59_ANGAN
MMTHIITNSITAKMVDYHI